MALILSPSRPVRKFLPSRPSVLRWPITASTADRRRRGPRRRVRALLRAVRRQRPAGRRRRPRPLAGLQGCGTRADLLAADRPRRLGGKGLGHGLINGCCGWRCPLYPAKQTKFRVGPMSANDPKRTFAVSFGAPKGSLRNTSLNSPFRALASLRNNVTADICQTTSRTDHLATRNSAPKEQLSIWHGARDHATHPSGLSCFLITTLSASLCIMLLSASSTASIGRSPESRRSAMKRGLASNLSAFRMVSGR